MTTMTTATDKAAGVSGGGVAARLTAGFGDAAAASPAWLAELRRKGAERFAALGVPTTKHEDWKYTSLRELEKWEVGPASELSSPVSAGQVDGLRMGVDAAARIVLVDGVYQPELSDVGELPAGVTVCTLAEAVERDEPGVREELGKQLDFTGDAFGALNTAMMADGVFVRAAKGVKLEKPVLLMRVASPTERPVASHPRSLVIAEEGSELTMVDDGISLVENAYLTNSAAEIVVGDNARVEHYYVERESRSSVCVSTRCVRVGRDGRFVSHAGLIGGRVCRNNIRPTLTGENGDVILNGFFLPGLDQVLDSAMFVRHEAPHCTSRQFYKGIGLDNGRGVFTGRIYVVREAQKTDAIQSNDNLLLSGEADVKARPQLEIYADDVRCTHGSTIGQLDEEALFYLRARGVPEEAARATLVSAFARENLERMELEPVRDWCARVALGRLPGHDLIDLDL